ncbi:MAG: hypothetical protein Q8867_05200 [Bacteroidota bacterium]|nr:hypothetical protein [Bacteroidota bacterium]
MKKSLLPLFIFLILFYISAGAQKPSYRSYITPKGRNIVKPMIDNIGYWKRMINLGYVKPDTFSPVPPSVFTTSRISAAGIRTQDSPDIPVTTYTSTQSENSVFICPEDESKALNSNNSTGWLGNTVGVLYGADGLKTEDYGYDWEGSIEGSGDMNNGDPATAIGRNGWWYVGKISQNYGQSVAYSTNQGATWHDVDVKTVMDPGNDILDKNHLWIDNSATSPYEGNLYDAWTNFVQTSPNYMQIELCRSTNHGLTWDSPINISEAVNAGSHNQGVNLTTGPNGEAYAVWAIYDSYPSDEKAIGFAKSITGGAVFAPAKRIIDNIRGIRMSETSKYMRVNSFPSATVDNSNGPNRGTIYVTWANIGVPGINTGSDIDIYMIRSKDNGDTWSAPIRINQDPSGLGKQHFFPWITCDPDNGYLSVIYYDDRNCDTNQCETYISYSYNGGDTWTDLKVSDVKFTPHPISGLAIEYFGDYLGIASKNRKVYPVWTDNRYGYAMSYISPVDLNPAPGQPYVIYYSYDLQKIGKSGSTNLNYGDSLHLTLSLQNIGDHTADSTFAYISTTNPYITVSDSMEYYGALLPGEIKSIPNGYSLKVSDTIPDGERVLFRVHVINKDTSWYSQFVIEARSPSLKITDMTIIDSLTGNGNERLDPGETADIKVSVTNTGHFACPATGIRFRTSCSFLAIQNDSIYFDTLAPGDTITAVFHVIASDDAPLGTHCNLDFRATSGLYSTHALYREFIGLIVEDWETNGFKKFKWYLVGGNNQWQTTSFDKYEGHYSVRSGTIYDNQYTPIQVSYVTGADDSISFYRKVSSEAGWDFLQFFIDNVKQGEWSGERNWEREIFFVPAGSHIFKWIYYKDGLASAGQDRSYIDFIVFPQPPLPQVNAGKNDTICSGSSYTLQATASAYDSLKWETYGDGTFSNDTLINPVYSPGPQDISTGSVRLRLTAFGTYGKNYSSTWLTIKQLPAIQVTVYPRDTLCSDKVFTLSVEDIPGAHYLWTPGGFTTSQIQVDTSVTQGEGTTLFNIRVSFSSECIKVDSATVTFKDCTGIDDHDADFRVYVYPNPCHGTFFLDLSLKQTADINLSLVNALNIPVYEEKGWKVTRKAHRKFEFPEIAPGMYYLRIESILGKWSQKIIISR